jgi:choline-phosphate cytidylyltransferase/glycerol-3-phosphate cytidylyltransferase
MRVITFGTYDIFHVGHVNIIERAKLHGDHLIVGVSSDKLNISKKGRPPVYCEDDRQHILRSMRCVDDVFLEESLELKADYIKYYNADILIMGDDWQGKFDHLKDICQVIYLPRTPSVSTTEIIEVVKTKRL